MPDNDDQPQTPQRGDPKQPKGMPKGLFSWVLVLGISLTLLVMFGRNLTGYPMIKLLPDFWLHVSNGNVVSIELQTDDTLYVKLRKPLPENGKFDVQVKYPGIATEFTKFVDEVRKTSGDSKLSVEDKRSNNLLMTMLIQLLPWIILLAIPMWFIARQLKQASSGAGGVLGNFGRSRHRLSTKEHTHVTFADVAGIEEAKDELLEIVEFLKNPKRFQRLGGRIPRGVLLVGEPGCGKTLLAKAIAGEAEVPFFSISGSDFVEMFVGVGASRVRDLFRQAKENSPCIIFLDEIDAVGRRRGLGYNGGGHDEREQTLNAILVEMDGFDTNDGVIVIAATNRSDVLDPALVRPGRFDRQVYVPLPDVKGRFDILRVHAKKVKIAPPVDPKLHRLARATPMFSGADLAATINEAALLATLASKDAIELEDLEEARDKVRWGRAKRSRVVEEKERLLTAYHEAGHALVQSLLKDADPVHKVSIIPRGPYGGVTFSLPEQDRHTINRGYIYAWLRIACAGRLAEELVGQDMNSGAEGDIKQATSMARRMVTEWGMSEKLGFVFYGDDPQARGFELGLGKEFSNKTAELIDAEVKRLVDEAYDETRRLLAEHRPKLEAIAQALLKYETIEGEDVRKLMAGETIDRPTVADLIAAEQGRRSIAPPVVARPVTPPPDSGGPLPSPA